MDLNNEDGKNKLLLESLQDENTTNVNNIQIFEKVLEETVTENQLLSSDITQLTAEIESLDKEIFTLNQRINEQEYKNLIEYNDLQSKIEKENSNLQIILSQLENFHNQENHNKNKNLSDYLEKKFSNDKFDEKYIIQNINKDIIDFQSYIKEQMQKKQIQVTRIVSLLQGILDESGFDYQIQIFGSYATGLSLPCSDLDMILIPRTITNGKEYSVLQSLYIKLQDIKYLSTPKLIENFIYPFIAIQTNEQYDFLNINISIQDIKHTGLQCVEFVKQYLNSYKILEPLNLTIKQILKNANLLYFYVRILI